MLTSVCMIPGTPLVVPQAAGGAGAETDGLRARVLAAVQAMAAGADRWYVVGAGERGDGLPQASLESYPAHFRVGTFSGFGPDVRVALSAGRTDEMRSALTPDPAMPLPLLIAGWLRGVVPESLRPAGTVTGMRAGRGAPPQRCLDEGRRLRGLLDDTGLRTGVLVVADGPTTMTAKAPGAFDKWAGSVADTVAAAVRDGDAAALGGLDARLCEEVGADGRAAWQVAAGLAGTGGVRVEHAWCGWPYGVCYQVGLWALETGGARDAGASGHAG